MPEKYWPETIILWGAGATKYLGLHTTKGLIEIIFKIIKNDFSFLNGRDKSLSEAFKKLITEELVNDKKLSQIYDLKALSIILSTNPGFNMNELFTMLDQLIENNMGFNAFVNNKTEFLRVERIKSAKRCLILLIEELERISVQNEPGHFDKIKIDPYYKFSKVLSELMIDEGKEFDKRGYKRDTRRFYMYSYGIISFNWDPTLLWNLYNAQREENRKKIKLEDDLTLKLSSDFGIQIASAGRVHDDSEICYTTDESKCRIVNDYKYPSRVLRIGKILFPHGMFGSRICPECGKSIVNFSDNFNRLSTEVFGPSLSNELQVHWNYNTKKERLYERGAIECPYCGQITYPYDMPIIMQTLAGENNIVPLCEIKTEMGLLMKNAKHIVFAGYSLPLDDIMVKTFFMSSISGNDKRKLKCTVINYDSEYGGDEKWLEGEKIVDYINKKGSTSTARCIKSVCDIFNIENIRVSLKGIPDVFMENGNCSRDDVIDLLYPKKYFKEGFPIRR